MVSVTYEALHFVANSKSVAIEAYMSVCDESLRVHTIKLMRHEKPDLVVITAVAHHGEDIDTIEVPYSGVVVISFES